MNREAWRPVASAPRRIRRRMTVALVFLFLGAAVAYWVIDSPPERTVSSWHDGGVGVTKASRRRPNTETKVPPADWDFEGRVDAAKSRESRKLLLNELLFPRSPEFCPGDGVDRLFKVWFKTDPVGALDAIELIGSTKEPHYLIRLNALICGVEAYASDPGAIDAKALECLFSDECSSYLADFRRMLYPALGEANPQAGVQLLKTTNPANMAHLFKLMCQTWVQCDPRAAVKEMAKFGNLNPDLIADCACTLHYAKLKFTDVQWALAERLPPEIVDKFATVATTATIRECGIKEYLRQLSRASGIDSIARPVLAAATAADPSGFVENMDGFENAGLFNKERDSEVVIRALFSADQPSALSFFERLASSPRAQVTAAAALSAVMLWKDANRCAQWISSLSSGPVRNAALEPMLGYLRSHNETNALGQWEALKSDYK